MRLKIMIYEDYLVINEVHLSLPNEAWDKFQSIQTFWLFSLLLVLRVTVHIGI